MSVDGVSNWGELKQKKSRLEQCLFDAGKMNVHDHTVDTW
jgi:hypothetical protein